MKKALAILILVSAAALAVIVSGDPPRSGSAPGSEVDRGPAPFEGRATLDHQGQPMGLLPSDEKVEMTK